MNSNVQSIPSSQAFKSGADLWLLSDPKHSFWHHKIDWHTGFLLQKMKLQKIKTIFPEARSRLEHTQKKLAESLKNLPTQKKQIELDILTERNITKSLSLDFQKEPLKPCPILVESSFYFPNLWILELPYTIKWLNTAYQIWHSLNRPTLRIFTPKLVKADDIEKTWSSPAKNITIQYVIGK